MISKVTNIVNLGRFENFTGSNEFKNNTILFGFNGAGKSTLSDIFYSLANESEGSDDLLFRRRTLNREGEEGEKKIQINIEADNGDVYSFSDNGWDKRPDNLYVFNEKYVDEHVFVSKQVEDGVIKIGLGPEAAKLMNQKENLKEKINGQIESINKNIEYLSKADLKISDFSQQRVSMKTKKSRFEKMASFELYPVGEKTKIDKMLKQNEQYSRQLEILDMCNELYSKIRNVEPINIGDAFKIIKRVPRVSSKELASFLENNLTKADINWAIRGFKNQKTPQICPMCGQNIVDKQAIVFFKKLGKFISQNRSESIEAFSKQVLMIAARLDSLAIGERIAIFADIIKDLNVHQMLLKRDNDRLIKGLSWTSKDTEIITTIIGKMHEKAQNPYLDVFLSAEERAALKKLNDVIRHITILGSILESTKLRIAKQLESKFRKEEVGKIYELSYGNSGYYRTIAEEIKILASAIIRNLEKIDTLAEKINDCFNQNLLNEVNTFLRDLNTHITIEVSGGQFFVKLKDYLPKKIDARNETIYSEGEHRAIALAYFLAEITRIDTTITEKIIVIDDPISSMDLSRKSIVSHKVSELMNCEANQIILMTHDISFVERVKSYLKRGIECDMYEVRSGKNDFVPLKVEEYLTDDKTVYENFIKQAENSTNELDIIIAMMSFRPFSYVNKVSEDKYIDIEKRTTYFAHTLYSWNRSIRFTAKNYDSKKLKTLVRIVNRATGFKFNEKEIVGDYSFAGLDFDKISNLYTNIPLDSMDNMRKKVMLMRPLLEACCFQFSKKDHFNPEDIGQMYKKAIKANSGDSQKKKICEELLELYDASKKYHHGAESGSLLGISWINPNEIEFFDEKICTILNIIRDNSMVRGLTA